MYVNHAQNSLIYALFMALCQPYSWYNIIATPHALRAL